MSSSSRNKAIIRYNTGEDGPSTSDGQRNETSVKRRKNQTNEASDQLEDTDRIVSDCIKYLLTIDYKKTPIKRIDLLKAVLKQTPNRKTVEEILEKVRSQLSKTFAIELSECTETPNSYILINKLPTNGLKETIESELQNDSQLFQSGVLAPILAVIFMSGGTVHEDVIWKFIQRFGFDVNSKSKTIEIENESNGITIKKLLTELWVRQLYLKYQKIPRSDPIAHEFKWGFRAEKEFSKMDVLKFVCETLGESSQPQSWRTQYEIAIQENQSHNENEIEVQVIP